MTPKRGKAMILLAVALILFTTVVGNVYAASTDPTGSNALTSSATGEILVSPDKAEISVSVQTENADVKIAQADNARIMDSVMNALQNAGISKDQIKTTGYNIYPVYDDTTGMFSKNVKLYQVTNSLVITLNDISRVGDVIDIAVANGANQVNYIQFMLSPEKEQANRGLAITRAVQQTRADADAAAKAMGVNITGVKEATIGSSLPPVLYESAMAKGVGGAANVPTPITPGDVKVSATVTVSYLFQ